MPNEAARLAQQARVEQPPRVPLTWYLCDLKTGDVWVELPLRPTGDLEHTIGGSSSLGVELDVHDPACPANWAELIDPRRAMIVPVADVPLVGYFIDKDTAGEPSATFTLTSLEGVLDYSFVRTHDFFEDVDDEADVAAALVADVVAPSFGFSVDVTKTGRTGDHSYAFEEDRTVLSALNDLMSAAGGPEWTVRLAWEDNRHRRFVKTIVIAPRVGHTIPSTVVENRHLVSRSRNRSSARGDRAIHVIATGDGSGPDRPMSQAFVDQDALDAGVPQWEARLSATAVDDPAQLDRIAEAGLRRRWSGITTWETRLALTEPGCPRLGVDFDAGDTIRIESGPTLHDPATWSGMARIIGWRANVTGGVLTTVTPVFWDQREEGVS